MPAYGNLAASLLALDRPTEARARPQDAADQTARVHRRAPAVVPARVRAGRCGDDGARARGLGRRRRDQRGVRLAGARVRLRGTRAAGARGVRPRHADVAPGNFTEVAAQLTIEDAEDACDRWPVRATPAAKLTAGLALSRDNGTLEHASRALALCGAEREALDDVDRAGEGDFLKPMFTNRLAHSADGRRDRARARRGGSALIELLEPVRAIRPRAVGRILACLPARPGLSALEERPGRGRGIPRHDRSPRRSSGVDAVSAFASRSGARGGVDERQRRTARQLVRAFPRRCGKTLMPGSCRR